MSERLQPEYCTAEIFKKVISDAYAARSSNPGDNNRKQLIEQITGHNNKLTKARELLLNEEICSADYRLIKTETESKIMLLEARISE